MLIETASDDERTATALHESAHAIAYINMGRSFRYITMHPRGGAAGRLQPHRQPIDAFTKAVVAMAGPAAEALMFHHGTGSDDDVISSIHEHHAESIQDADIEGESNDYVDAGSLALIALPVCLSIVTTRWTDIEQIAGELLTSTRAITYKRVIQMVGSRRVNIQAAYERWTR